MWNTALLQLLVALLGNAVAPGGGTQLQYDIIHNDESVGVFKASKVVDGDQTTFVNTTDIRTRVVKEINVKLHIQSTFSDKVLSHSKVVITLNGKTYTESITKKTAQGYEFYKDGALKSKLMGPIRYSAAMMIFSAPVGIGEAYSEEVGDFHTIKPGAKGVYEKKNARGRTTIYHYQDQILKSLDVDLGLTEIEMVLKN